MTKRTVADLMLIIAVYAVYWSCIYLATSYNLPQQLQVVPPQGVEETDFLLNFNYWSLVVMGISLLSAFGWYVLGAWGPKAYSTALGTWILIWFMGLALALAAGFMAIWLGPQAGEKAYVLAAFYLVAAALFYYLATMLFSPVNIKYVVPGSKLFRRW
ncbi:MAG TPA: hypothetical protein VFF39_07970 [Verrucomicrobiae bacterium]|nr:hypothetical protein [Verrucomicrobiae bacterium]